MDLVFIKNCDCCRRVMVATDIQHNFCNQCQHLLTPEVEIIKTYPIVEELQAKIKMLKEALKPFADFANYFQSEWPSATGLNRLYTDVGVHVSEIIPTLGDCRKAKDAYDS